jgi:hypothetical protein
MQVTLPLDKMTAEDKIRLIEEIWEDLSRNAEDVQIPAWHVDLLRERERRLREGKVGLTDWDDAEREIRDLIR